MKQIFARLKTLSPTTAEALYQDLYPACAGSNLGIKDAAELYHRIQQQIQTATTPVIKSYCLLFYSAVVDSKKLSALHLADLSHFLSSFLAELEDYRVKDTDGNYIHYLSHATYLAHSIHEASGQVSWPPLLDAYLRANIAFAWNEDVVLAECLLGLVPPTDFTRVLARLKTGTSEGAKASNKRALWMAMKVLNQKKPRQNGADFAVLEEELAALVG